MKQFITAVESAEETPVLDRKFHEFEVAREVTQGGKTKTVVDRKVKMYEADEAQLSMFLASVGRWTSTSTKIAGTIEFFMSLFEEKDQGYFGERLLNPGDKFGIDQVEQILHWLTEEMTGNPTVEPSGSPAS